MKGLLHRLAARAVGTAVPVRSDARLPFGGADLSWGEVIEFDAAPEPLVMAAASNSPRLGEAGPFPGQPVGLDYDAPARETARSPYPQRDDSEHGTPMLDRHGPPPTLQDAGADVQTNTPATVPPATSVPLGQPEPMLPARLIDSRPAAVTKASPASAEPHHGPALRPPAKPTSPLSPDAPLRSNDEPPLLIPRGAPKRAPTAGLSVAAHEPAWPNITAQGTADEPKEVHIHIGRIEVTAMHEAPVQRPKPKAIQAPLSLEAYLAGRSKT